MTRKESIEQAAKAFIKLWLTTGSPEGLPLQAFIAGAQWADNNPEIINDAEKLFESFETFKKNGFQDN